MNHAVGAVFKKSSLYPGSSRFSPVLSSRGVIVLCSTFVSVGHFVKDISSVFTFLFPACGCLAVPGPLAEKTTCVPLSKIS